MRAMFLIPVKLDMARNIANSSAVGKYEVLLCSKTGHDRVLTSDEDVGMSEEKKGKRQFEAEEKGKRKLEQ